MKNGRRGLTPQGQITILYFLHLNRNSWVRTMICIWSSFVLGSGCLLRGPLKRDNHVINTVNLQLPLLKKTTYFTGGGKNSTITDGFCLKFRNSTITDCLFVMSADLLLELNYHGRFFKVQLGYNGETSRYDGTVPISNVYHHRIEIKIIPSERLGNFT